MRLPTGYVLPPSTKKQIKDLTRTNWLMPVLLALGDHALILALAIIGYLVWDALPWPLAAITTAMIYIAQARGLRGLENLVHDGSHFNWGRKPNWTNDFLTNLLAAWPVFSSVAVY